MAGLPGLYDFKRVFLHSGNKHDCDCNLQLGKRRSALLRFASFRFAQEFAQRGLVFLRLLLFLQNNFFGGWRADAFAGQFLDRGDGAKALDFLLAGHGDRFAASMVP